MELLKLIVFFKSGLGQIIIIFLILSYILPVEFMPLLSGLFFGLIFGGIVLFFKGL